MEHRYLRLSLHCGGNIPCICSTRKREEALLITMLSYDMITDENHQKYNNRQVYNAVQGQKVIFFYVNLLDNYGILDLIRNHYVVN